eukprot:6059808-Alexandrium_andersonii.AAC.1
MGRWSRCCLVGSGWWRFSWRLPRLRLRRAGVLVLAAAAGVAGFSRGRSLAVAADCSLPGLRGRW